MKIRDRGDGTSIMDRILRSVEDYSTQLGQSPDEILGLLNDIRRLIHFEVFDTLSAKVGDVFRMCFASLLVDIEEEGRVVRYRGSGTIPLFPDGGVNNWPKPNPGCHGYCSH